MRKQKMYSIGREHYVRRSWGGKIPGAFKQLEETCLTGAWKMEGEKLRDTGSGGETRSNCAES